MISQIPQSRAEHRKNLIVEKSRWNFHRDLVCVVARLERSCRMQAVDIGCCYLIALFCVRKHFFDALSVLLCCSGKAAHRAAAVDLSLGEVSSAFVFDAGSACPVSVDVIFDPAHVCSES